MMTLPAILCAMSFLAAQSATDLFRNKSETDG